MTEQERLLLIAHTLSGRADEGEGASEWLAERAISIADAVHEELAARKAKAEMRALFDEAAFAVEPSRLETARTEDAARVVKAVLAIATDAGYHHADAGGSWRKVSLAEDKTPFAYIGVTTTGHQIALAADGVPAQGETTGLPTITFDSKTRRHVTTTSDHTPAEVAVALALVELLKKG